MTEVIKSPNQWLIQYELVNEDVEVGRWMTTRRTVGRLNLPTQESEVEEGLPSLLLTLYRDERTDYRFNLSSSDPHLFFIFEVNEDESVVPLRVSASQTIAATHLDGDYLVLAVTIPLAVQAWMEAFIGRHGELIEEPKKKRKKGAGRASGR
ncbi:DUF3305 domain-containing protein [Enterovibrio nigricans]|uniref:DUF3305 domain-containing protein n=1 Tax=Enterovibrio nigricans DSM 22720 TaxID=1121868 RepID=A0A1T4UAU4_9GAMM|nr:DUF3305 domain-containing protein [Enterovibrio nigricans]PKF51584.1 DUF3305 domain-containing protein [Enterovibrio nigricans]SKA49813.1 Protein of unknown function [Enterovibrio nigricans DSM 22720]